MKYNLYILITFTIFFPNSSLFGNKMAEKKLITELIVADNDSTFRYVYLYDNQAIKVLETKYFEKNNIWNRIYQTEWINENGKCKNQIERKWSIDKWLNTYKIEYNYINNLLDLELHSHYINNIAQQQKKIQYEYSQNLLTSKNEYVYQTNDWTLASQTKTTYLSTNNVDSTLTTVYNFGNVSNKYLTKNHYNSIGLLTSQLQQEKIGTNDWHNTLLTNWIYYANSTQVQTQKTKKWLPERSIWENYQLIDLEYNTSKKLTSETYQHWKTMFWESDLRYDYLYNTAAILYKKILSKPIYHEWRELTSINYSDFDSESANLIEAKFEFWGGTTGELTSAYIPFNFNNEISIEKCKSIKIKYLYSPDIIQSIPENTNYEPILSVFPNPSIGILYINTQEFKIQSWTITDLTGKTQKNQQQLSGSGAIDITDLNKGIYFLKIITDKGNFSKKIIKK